jgi:hypothetical protein
METEYPRYRGYLEGGTRYYNPGGGPLRPSDAIELAARICQAEEREGRPVVLEDLFPFDQELCQRFAVWVDAPRYGQLAVMLRDEARRLVSLS